MDISEATNIADAILYTYSSQHLSDIERLVLKGSLQKLRYETISAQENHAHQSVKDIGFRLWRKLSAALDGEEVKKSNIQAVLERHRSIVLSKVERESQYNFPYASSIDWADAPEFEPFFGRQDELSTLKQWILQDHCRLIAIVGMRGIGKTGLTVRLGMGGIGKTNLSLQLVQGIQHEFDYVIWRSLLNAPSFDDTLRDLILFLSDQQETELPEMPEAKVLSLIGYLKRQRCLLILDNVESILVGHQRSSQDSLNQSSNLLSEQYRDGYENYGHLFRKVGEVAHKSCLLLTSREKPKSIESLASDHSKIRFFQLFGLKNEDAKKIFKCNKIGVQAESALESIIHFYEGNPLALKLVLKRIENVFGGNVAEFLEQDNPFFEDISELLNWHFSRLSPVEKEIIYWLAINREPTSVATLKNDIISLGLGDTVTDTLALLQLRLPIIRTALGFTLQPVIIEYLNNNLVKLVCQEIQSGHISLLNRVCLQKGLAKAYVRETQKRLILLPIVNKLVKQYHHPSYIVQQLNSILSIIRETPIFSTGYATGNIISILSALGADLTGYDFSQLTIRQAYLQNIFLKRVNFSYSDLSTTTFT